MDYSQIKVALVLGAIIMVLWFFFQVTRGLSGL